MVSGFAFGQNDCQPGYTWMPTLSAGSAIFLADTCLPDSTAKRMFLNYSKHACEEGGLMAVGEKYLYASTPKWMNDSTGCVTKETFKKKVKGEWVEISGCRYYWENKGTTCSVYSEGKSIDVPCCGHIHTIAPE